VRALRLRLVRQLLLQFAAKTQMSGASVNDLGHLNLQNHSANSRHKSGQYPTARLFATSTLSVSEWWRGYQQHDLSGLPEPSRAPNRHPFKTPPQIEPQVVALVHRLPTFGAARIISHRHTVLHSLKQIACRDYFVKSMVICVSASFSMCGW